jgi:hypothetical protein
VNEDEVRVWMERMKSTEPLHPDLVPHLYETDVIGMVLKHPLVFSVPYTGPGHSNLMYEQKTLALGQALREKRWHTYVFLHERPHRIEALVKIQEHLSDRDYWELVGGVWIDSENIFQCIDEWSETLGSPRKYRRHIMDADERRDLRAMPETITIYRGCRREMNEDGWSWTTDRAKAEWFAKRHPWSDGNPLVIEATVPKKHVVAYFTGRNESEIVAYSHAVDIVMYHEV